ncbi:MAG TPA: hypothetical protein VLR10_02780 [Nitrososphaeraceae archaeon]|nr:hypothetical protein [Nitrososphaeraceae archaeon]
MPVSIPNSRIVIFGDEKAVVRGKDCRTKLKATRDSDNHADERILILEGEERRA